MQINRITGLIILICMLAISCGRHHDGRLERIWDTVSDTPRDALMSLDSIDPSTLSESDRAFYNLLSIKAKDKAYISHTSDSLIMGVINHYTRHQDKELYPEALYYAGRVYSDLGDYSTAIDYFQKALNLLPAGTENRVLRGKMLSQPEACSVTFGYTRSLSLTLKRRLSVGGNRVTASGWFMTFSF